MAMDRETLEKMKEKSREKLQERIEHAPIEQLDALHELKKAINTLQETETEQLKVQKSTNNWVRFFGVLAIISLSFGVLMAILAIAHVF